MSVQPSDNHNSASEEHQRRLQEITLLAESRARQFRRGHSARLGGGRRHKIRGLRRNVVLLALFFLLTGFLGILNELFF